MIKMYENYYNPYPAYDDSMQRRLAELQRQQQTHKYSSLPVPPPSYDRPLQQQMPPVIKGRIVTSIDEARAAQIDLDGTSTYFPSPAEGKIYEKLIGLDGMPIFRVYEIKQANEQKPVYAEKNIVLALQARIEKLEHQIGGMTYDEYIPDDEDGAASRKSNGNAQSNRRGKSANGQGNGDGAGQVNR